jgi:hypothetical protein
VNTFQFETRFKRTKWKTWIVRANPTELFLFKMQKMHMLSLIPINARRMPRLSLQQWEQAIGRLNAGQRPQLVHAFNCNIRTVQSLWERNNDISSTEQVRSDHRRVITPRQNRYILRQHMNNQFTTATQTSWQAVGSHQRPITVVITLFDVD